MDKTDAETTVLFCLQDAMSQAGQIIEGLAGTYERIEIAGSIRRKRPQVHDIDLVLFPKWEMVTGPQVSLFPDYNTDQQFPTALVERLEAVDWAVKVSRAKWPRHIPLIRPGMPAELWICEPSGGNFEALLQMRTGSKEFNLSLIDRADRLGRKYGAGYGIFSADGVRVDDGTEAGIFSALGIQYIPPELRNDDFHRCVIPQPAR